jgi:hypothetical protein
MSDNENTLAWLFPILRIFTINRQFSTNDQEGDSQTTNDIVSIPLNEDDRVNPFVEYSNNYEIRQAPAWFKCIFWFDYIVFMISIVFLMVLLIFLSISDIFQKI